MSARVQWSGLNELIQALTDAPEEIRTEGFQIVRDETEGAAQEISSDYAKKTGRLARRVKTMYPSTDVIAGIVQSSAPHAAIYEKGTEQRHTNQGWNRGRMPANPVVGRVASKRRARMFARLKDMLTRRGFVLSEE